ncbi:hypothetical protein [Saccharothrix hoggarensis]|uniref:PH (Pleckstrin Homology) domain-containing protein n=1 Tax=Saccharothrix hoggarensis TaxID=913853 RepID=A0ABW3QRU0_9PSEU
MLRLPFGVHDEVRAEFERRWARTRPLLLLGFLAPPAVSLAVAVVARWSGVPAVGWVLLLVGCGAPAVFLFRRVYVHRTGWWGGVVAYSGAVQVLGLGLVTARALLVLPTVAAIVAGVLLVTRARVVLLDETGGAIAATTLGVRSASRQVRGPTGKLLAAHATVDGEVLRWHVTTGASIPDTCGGELPLREITDVWVAETRDAPGGPVVVVRAGGRDLELVVGHPHDFASVLDRRLRLLGGPGWSQA